MRLLSLFRRRSATAPARIEPTLDDKLAPARGSIPVRIRLNAGFAVVASEQELALHGLGIDSMWRDACGDAPSREMTAEIIIPDPAVLVAAPKPAPASPPAPTDSASTLSASPLPAAGKRASTPRREAPVTHRRSQSERHAHRLLAYAAELRIGGVILATVLQQLYHRMCEAEELTPRPWNQVSPVLTRLTTGHKDYRWVPVNGKPRRLRIFKLPTVTTSNAGPAHDARIAA
jgi:hypothetical protein